MLWSSFRFFFWPLLLMLWSVILLQSLKNFDRLFLKPGLGLGRTRMPVKFYPPPSWWWSETQWLTSLRLLIEMHVCIFMGKDEAFIFLSGTYLHVGSGVVKITTYSFVASSSLFHSNQVEAGHTRPKPEVFIKTPSRTGEVKLSFMFWNLRSYCMCKWAVVFVDVVTPYLKVDCFTTIQKY